MGVHDVPCTRIRESIPQQLRKLDIPYEWHDKNEGMLSVGPFVEDIDSANTYSRIWQNYCLDISCSDELTTSITGNATLEGLNADNKWVPITDVQTVEKIALVFLRSLDL